MPRALTARLHIPTLILMNETEHPIGGRTLVTILPDTSLGLVTVGMEWPWLTIAVTPVVVDPAKKAEG